MFQFAANTKDPLQLPLEGENANARSATVACAAGLLPIIGSQGLPAGKAGMGAWRF